MSKFRIKEHMGIFIVEKKFTEIIKKKTLFFTTITKEVKWGECTNEGYGLGRYNSYLILPHFKTLGEAQKAIDEIIKFENDRDKKPIYHEYPPDFKGHFESLYNEYS